VVVVGAGPVGLSIAMMTAQGQKVLLLDNDDTVSIGSRGVCYAKRALGARPHGLRRACVDKGVSWNVGRTFLRGRGLRFNLRPRTDHHRPA
jgi:3-(3-hydroxy-phenyl)propionate hydroxylase